MARVIWTEPAISDLDAIGDYVAIDNPAAAMALVTKIFGRVEQLIAHPKSGRSLRELPGMRYRELIEPPARIIYRVDRDAVRIVHVLHERRLLRPGPILER